MKKELTPQLKDLAPHVFVSALHDRQKRFGRKRNSQMKKAIRPVRYCEGKKVSSAKV
jgi:hypothetical protein